MLDLGGCLDIQGGVSVSVGVEVWDKGIFRVATQPYLGRSPWVATVSEGSFEAEVEILCRM